MVKDQLAQIGIEVLGDRSFPSATLFDHLGPTRRKRWSAASSTSSSSPGSSGYDPGSGRACTRMHSSIVPSRANGYRGGNYGNYKNPRTDQLLDQTAASASTRASVASRWPRRRPSGRPTCRAAAAAAADHHRHQPATHELQAHARAARRDVEHRTVGPGRLASLAVRLFFAIELPAEVRARARSPALCDDGDVSLGRSGIDARDAGVSGRAARDSARSSRRASARGCRELGSRRARCGSARRAPSGRARAPRVLWIGLGGDVPALLALQSRLAARLLREAGFALEDRPFSPHITLARRRERRALGGTSLATSQTCPQRASSPWPS